MEPLPALAVAAVFAAAIAFSVVLDTVKHAVFKRLEIV